MSQPTTQDEEIDGGVQPAAPLAARVLVMVAGVGALVGAMVAVAALPAGDAPVGAGTADRRGAGDAPSSAGSEDGSLVRADLRAEAGLRSQREVRVQAVTDAIVAGQGSLAPQMPQEEAMAAAKKALAKVLGEQPKRTALALEVLQEIGPGRFVRGGQLTPLGAAVASRVGELERHAIPAAGYDKVALAGVIVDLRAPQALGGDGEGHGAALREMVLGTSDVDRIAARVRTMEPLPAASEVDAGVARAVKAGARSRLMDTDIGADMRLYATFIQLVLDFRFVKRVGPTTLRKASTVLSRRREARKLKRTLLELLTERSGADAVADLDPPHPHYQRMLEIQDIYAEIVARGGCGTLNTKAKIKPGKTGDGVKALQERLRCEGYYAGEVDGVYEGKSILAMRRYQRHHELKADGLAYEGTLKSLNIPMSKRLAAIRLALARMRESPIAEMGSRFIRVNLPAFQLEVWEDGAVVRRHKVIVGTNRLDDDKQALIQGHLNRTKLFTTRLYEIIVNPAWYLPRRVVTGELKGHMEDDPDYLKKNNIKLVTLDGGGQVYVQGFGPGNVLGQVKFLLEESNAIFLHDTDKRGMFDNARRDFSHGCVRVDDAVDFAQFLLAADGRERKEVDKALALVQYQRGYKLKEPIDLITEYQTVDISDEGLPVFLTDIYRYDRAVFRDRLPVQEKILWGSAELRPSWVPRVSSQTVEGWRAKGMAAPRSYDPEIHGK